MSLRTVIKRSISTRSILLIWQTATLVDRDALISVLFEANAAILNRYGSAMAALVISLGR